MFDQPTALLTMLPPALTAWSAAAALVFVLLEVKSVPSARYWAIGFVLIGFGALTATPPGVGQEIGLLALAGLGAYGLGVVYIGVGLSRYTGLDVPKAAALGSGMLVFGGLVALGAAVPGDGVACVLETWITTILCVALAGFALLSPKARRHGGGMKFVALALLLMAVRPLLPMISGETTMGAVLALSILTVAPILLCLGLAVIVLRGQESRARESDRRRRWTEDRYALAMKGANDGVWDWDLEQDKVHVTQRLREISGLPETGDPSSEDIMRKIHPGDAEPYRAMVRDVILGAKETLNFEVRLDPAERGGSDLDEPAWVLIRGLPVRGADGRVSRMAGTITDVTERKRAERQLIDAKEEAELASRSKTEFLAHMSHELRTPLNSIIGFSDMMQSEVYGPIKNTRYEDYVGTINMAGRHLLSLISDIIDVSKVESGQTRLEDTLCDLNEIAESALRLVAERIDQAGLSLTSEIAEDLPWLRGDEIRIKQIILNLMTNAAKFTPPGGGVTLIIDTTPTGQPRIVVSDTGIGISRKDIPRALSRFGRLASPFTRTTEGMGLGLTLVQMFVDLHGGRFTLESDEGEGTRVEVVFPIDRVQARPPSESQATGSAPAAA